MCFPKYIPFQTRLYKHEWTWRSRPHCARSAHFILSILVLTYRDIYMWQKHTVVRSAVTPVSQTTLTIIALTKKKVPKPNVDGHTTPRPTTHKHSAFAITHQWSTTDIISHHRRTSHRGRGRGSESLNPPSSEQCHWHCLCQTRQRGSVRSTHSKHGGTLRNAGPNRHT